MAATATLEEIVVTAQKRSEQLLDVPVSVAALDAEGLVADHATGIEDYYSTVPGLALNAQTGGRLSLAIRGITTGGASSPTVGITIDDVPIGSSAGYTYAAEFASDIDPAMLERVEVLRGPQGTLYGATSLGGLLRYVTVKPRLNELSGRAQLDGFGVEGSDEGYTLRGAANLPVVDDRMAMQLSAFTRHEPGFVDNEQTGEDEVNSEDSYGGRLAALWRLTDAATLQVSALYQHTEGDGSSDVETDASLDTDGPLAHTRNPGTGHYSREQQQYDATFEVDFGWGVLSSITGYGVSEMDETIDVTATLGFLTEIATGRDDLGSTTFLPNSTDKFSQEFRLTSRQDSRLEWLLGVFYTHEDSDVAYNIYAVDPQSGDVLSAVILDSFPSTFEEYALFGTATWHFTDQLDLQVGGRYSEEEQEFDETISGPLFDPPYRLSEDSSGDKFTWLIAPSYKPSDDVLVYGRIATGYRPGGPNPGGGLGFPSQFEPDETTSYELGLKGYFLNQMMSLDLSAYYIDWDNIQVQLTDLPTGFLYYANAGKARSQGLELSLAAAPATGLTIAATTAYTDAELSDSGGIAAVEGERLPYSAEWTATLSVDQEFDLTSRTSAFIGGTLAYVGGRYDAFQSDPGVPRVELPSYTTLDLRAGFRFEDWTFSLYAKNLTDERGILGASPEVPDASTGVYVMSVIQPRTIGLSAAVTF
jgi:outer membrane receptor protein involved in Fe transport